MDDTPSTVQPPKVIGGRKYSPSPNDAEQLPQRRTEDTKSYIGEWSVLLLALAGWATTFCVDMAAYETFDQIWTPKFLGIHVGQLLTVTVSVFAAKRIR